MSSTAQPLPTTKVLTAIAGEQILALPSSVTGLIASCPCSPPPPGAAPWLGGVALWREQGRDQVIWVLDPVGLGRASAMMNGERLLVLVESGGGAAGWAVLISAPSALADATPIGGEVLAACPGGWLRHALLADGRRAWLLDPDAINRSLHAAEAA